MGQGGGRGCTGRGVESDSGVTVEGRGWVLVGVGEAAGVGERAGGGWAGTRCEDVL